mmetsp:Transcript_34811/g.59834  ORF Transcript_34811/g.59834 Transcript_34811/m.59834 type:complete len:190 (-) Transcript_34811:136-705(-)
MAMINTSVVHASASAFDYGGLLYNERLAIMGIGLYTSPFTLYGLIPTVLALLSLGFIGICALLGILRPAARVINFFALMQQVTLSHHHLTASSNLVRVTLLKPLLALPPPPPPLPLAQHARDGGGYLERRQGALDGHDAVPWRPWDYLYLGPVRRGRAGAGERKAYGWAQDERSVERRGLDDADDASRG